MPLKAKKYKCKRCGRERWMTTLSHKSLRYFCKTCGTTSIHRCLERPPVSDLYERDRYNSDVLWIKQDV